MIKKINLEKILMIFIIIQPLLDFYLLYSESVTNVFRFSPSTIIRMAFVAFFTIYLLFKIKYNKKYIWIFVYLSFVLIYLILHVLNALNFNSDISGNTVFSYVTEAFYFIRMFIPILLVFITYNIKITEEKFRKTIFITSLIFSLVIIVTNILKISLTSYGGNTLISGNIFDWFFNNKYSFEQLASKGFFYMANQISGVLVLLLPINIYYAIKTSKKSFIFSSVCLVLSMIMLGTRVAVLGWVLISICIFFAWVFFGIIHKNKIGITLKKVYIYIFIFSALIFITSNSPLVHRSTSEDFEKTEKENLTKEIEEQYKNLKNDKEFEEFIIKYSDYYSIPVTFVRDLYPVESDSEFWKNVLTLPYYERGGNRNLENLITKRIYELNNNKYDKYLGMGYSRFRNSEIYIEQDFVVHYYTLGIVGIILFLGPYIAIATYALIYMLVKKKFRMETTILCMSVFVTLAISYFSGHVLDELIVTIILGFICGYILKLVHEPKEVKKEVVSMIKNIEYSKNSPYISIIVPIYNAEKYLEKTLDKLVNQTLKNIEIILIDDGSKDSSGNISDAYSKKYKNIIVKHIENGGVANARNVGISLSKGKYIGFVDSDDIIELDMYEKLYNEAIKEKSDIVACDVNIVYPTYNKIISSGITNCIKKDIEVKKNILINSYAVIWNKIYRKSLIQDIKFKDKSNFCEDVEFLFRVLPLAKSFSNVSEPLYNYIQNPGSLTYVYDKKLYQLIDNFDGLVDIYKDKKYNEYLEELEYSYVRYLYATFIKRLAKTKNKEEFNKGVNIVIEKVNKQYPNYKNNKYLRKFSFKNLYLKYFNKTLSSFIYINQKNKMN